MSRPTDIRKWIKTIDTKKLKVEIDAIVDSTDAPLNIWLYIDSSADGDVCVATRNLFLTSAPNVRVQIIYFDDVPATLEKGSDFAIVVAGKSSRIVDITNNLRAISVPAFIVVGDVDDFCASTSDEDLASLDGDWWAYDKNDDRADLLLQSRIASWIVAVCPDKKMSLGYAFKFVSRPIAKDAISIAAIENALISATPLVSSADSALFVVNQLLLLAQISAIYKKEISIELLKEAIALLAVSSVANKATSLFSSIMPLPKFVSRGCAYFAMTQVIGELLIEYFEAGGDISGVAKVIERIASGKKNISSKVSGIKTLS